MSDLDMTDTLTCKIFEAMKYVKNNKSADIGAVTHKLEQWCRRYKKDPQLQTLEERIAMVRNCHEIQGHPGNKGHNEYMRGMYNGLELAMATLEGRDHDFYTSDSVSKWINISDRLPVQHQSNRYLQLNLLLNNRTVTQGGWDDGSFWIDNVRVDNVTGWQLIPTRE
jgi:hypothetical protein